ncbi:LexA family protein [Devosia beringensis]|uniref:LexA family protein n=1 Tax=Devosia beringensis TaxID=2657486 RepID=UPI00186B9226|nr:hypothetical protein [Devosia beringensis]
MNAQPIPAEILNWAADFWDDHLDTDQVDMIALAFMAGQAAATAIPGGLTSAQAEALAFIRTYQAEHLGASPTYSQIAVAVGRSKTRAFDLVKGMKARGVVADHPNRPRSITITARA